MLHDRPNPADRILGGTLVFSDGTGRSPRPEQQRGRHDDHVPARTAASVQLNITSVWPACALEISRPSGSMSVVTREMSPVALAHNAGL